MSDHPHHGASKIHASKSGGGGKWLLIGLFALLIGGGGYYAYSTMMPGAPPPELAANEDTYADDPLYAGPIGDEDYTAESATLEAEPAAAAPVSAAPRAAAPAPRRAPPPTATPARVEVVPEATIGVTPVSLTTSEEGEDIVVTAPPRPVWARVPSERRLAHFDPERARDHGLEGEATLQCTVQTGGALDCAQVSESQRGFGNAALRVSRSLRHAAQTADGREAIGTPVNLRVVFRLEDGRRG